MKRRRPKKPTPCAYRLLQPLDVVDMIPMLADIQHGAAAAVGYPWMSERTPFELGAELEYMIRTVPTLLHVGAVVNYRRDPDGRVLDGKVKAFVIGRVLERTIGMPRRFLLVDFLYVDRAFRNRRIAPRLIYALTSLARTRFEVAHVECRYTPGTKIARTLERAGFRPYEVVSAFVAGDGKARGDVPFDRASRRAQCRTAKTRGLSSVDPQGAAARSSLAGPDKPTTI